MRALETEVSRLREAYTTEIADLTAALQQHKTMVHTMHEENEILKEILSAHGIQYEAEFERRRAERPPMPGYQSSPVTASTTGSHTAGITQNGSHQNATPPTTISTGLSPRAEGGIERMDVSPGMPYAPQQQVYQTSPGEQSVGLDLSTSASPETPVSALRGVFETDPQLQVDFILTYVLLPQALNCWLTLLNDHRLEGPCREHTDYLCRRSITEADDEDMPFSGHALMATCPPPSYIANTTAETPYPHKTYDLPLANLGTLLNLSRQLVTDGQITPIMALQCLKNHELYSTLGREDVKIIIETLNTKVRCYGFGAVVEDFELMDCLSSVVGTKVEVGMSGAHDDSMYA